MKGHPCRKSATQTFHFNKPFVAFAEQKGFLSSNDHSISDFSTTHFGGCCTAFILQPLNLKDLLIGPADESWRDGSGFFPIQIYRNIFFFS